MHLRIDHRRHYAVLLLMGPLEASDGAAAQTLLSLIDSSDRSRWLVDLTRLTAIDAAGLQILLAVAGRCSVLGRRLALLVAAGPVAEAVNDADLPADLPVFETLEAYVEAQVPEETLTAVGACPDDEHPMALVARRLVVTLSP